MGEMGLWFIVMLHDKALVVFLMQNDRVIAYVSRQLKKHEENSLHTT